MKKIILGVAGEIAAGKGTAAKYVVEKYEAMSFRFSTMLRDMLDRLYLEHSRENMQKISLMIRQGFGEDIMANVMFGDVKNCGSEVVVIDGVRREADIKYLGKLSAFKLVYIDADIKKRYERLIRRGENPDDLKKTFEEFKNVHEQNAELQIKGLKSNADFVIDNNGSFDDLYSQIDKIIKQ